jgi:uncharacterized damage-inducible protein DinB
MQPEQAGFLLQTVFLPSLKTEHGITKAVIAAIPLDKGDYRPDGISKSALDLAWHIVATEMLFLGALPPGEFEFKPFPCPDDVKDSAAMEKWYAENFEQRFDKLTKLSNEQLVKVIDFRGMFQLPAVMYLNFVLQHTAHHRGQLSMYLRPTGAKVPAIYGESFDSAEARKAAAK